MLVRREVARSLSKPRGGARPSRRDPISRPGRGDVGHHGVRHARGAVADDRVAQRRLVDLQRDGPRRRLRQVHARLSSQSLDVGSVRLDLLPGLALRPRPRLALRGLWGLWRHVSVYCRYGSCCATGCVPPPCAREQGSGFPLFGRAVSSFSWLRTPPCLCVAGLFVPREAFRTGLKVFYSAGESALSVILYAAKQLLHRFITSASRRRTWPPLSERSHSFRHTLIPAAAHWRIAEGFARCVAAARCAV